MKILEDIWSSIVGNATTRVNDPVRGTFLTSWCICFWHYLGLLFLGKVMRLKELVDFINMGLVEENKKDIQLNS